MQWEPRGTQTRTSKKVAGMALEELREERERFFNCDELPALLGGLEENNILLVVCLRGKNTRLITVGLRSY